MKCNRLVDVGRRQFLRGGVLGAAGLRRQRSLPAGQAQAQRSPCWTIRPPARQYRDLKVNEPMDIGYPDADSPGILLKLGTAVEGGAGPDGDIVAYSVLCPHKGWSCPTTGPTRR
jgi:arsenite oxidase small subunit